MTKSYQPRVVPWITSMVQQRSHGTTPLARSDEKLDLTFQIDENMTFPMRSQIPKLSSDLNPTIPMVILYSSTNLSNQNCLNRKNILKRSFLHKILELIQHLNGITSGIELLQQYLIIKSQNPTPTQDYRHRNIGKRGKNTLVGLSP